MFWLTPNVEIQFQPSQFTARALLACDPEGLSIISEGFTTLEDATKDTVGSEHILWQTSDYIRFDDKGLKLESFLISVPDYGVSPKFPVISSAKTNQLWEAKLASHYNPFEILTPTSSVDFSSKTLFVCYDANAIAKHIKFVRINLAMVFDEGGLLVGWLLTDYLENMAVLERKLAGSARVELYTAFESYISTFSQALFAEADDKILEACRRFIAHWSKVPTDPRLDALLLRVEDIQDRFS